MAKKLNFVFSYVEVSAIGVIYLALILRSMGIQTAIYSIIILIYFFSTHKLINVKTHGDSDLRLSKFTRICGYIGLVIGGIFVFIGVTGLITVIYTATRVTISMLIFPPLILLYGVATVYYVRKTMKILK